MKPTEVKPTQQPYRVLVIQTARLGDSIQSLMALRAAQQLYPSMEIHFLVREKFAEAARKISWVKEVIELPTEDLIGDYLQDPNFSKETQAMSRIADWLGPIVNTTWDLVANWGYSESSSFLTALIPGRVKIGFARRSDELISSVDGWSHFIQGVVQGQVDQNIHLTDIFTTQLLTTLQIHLGDPADAGDQAVTSKEFFDLHLTAEEIDRLPRTSSARIMAIQLGASTREKTYAPERWAQVCREVLQRTTDVNIILLGGPGEVDLEERLLVGLSSVKPSLRRRVHSMVGETSFPLWASVIGKCQWLLSADTAAIHLASVLGTRVLNLSIGSAKFEQTGPYGNGHFVIRNRDGSAQIDPQTIFQAWLYASLEWSVQAGGDMQGRFEAASASRQLDTIEVYRSRIRPPDEGGGVVFESELDSPMSVREWGSMVIGHVARAWYCGWRPEVGFELNRERLNSDLISELRKLQEPVDVLLRVCEKGSVVARELSARAKKMRSDQVMSILDREDIEKYSRELKEIDQMIERLGQVHPVFRSFAQMSTVLMHNLRGERIWEISKESGAAYSQLVEGVDVLREWVDYTIELGRPKPVRIVSTTTEAEL